MLSTAEDASAVPAAPAAEAAPERNWDMWFGCTLSIFAAVLSVNDLGAGKYGDDEIQLVNEKSGAYQWYQSKGIKESLAEGQRDLLKALTVSNTIDPTHAAGVQAMAQDLDKQIKRYKAEKKEILLGSEAVGKGNWVQDIDGKLGQVPGAKAIEGKLAKLGEAGDRFDLATLFLQLSIVMGAVGIIVKKDNVKTAFFGAMTVLGLVGTGVSVLAYRLALSA